MNRFTFTPMNYPSDLLLNSILKKGVESGLKSFKSITEHFIEIRFHNGTKITAWNVNRYYAWLSRGQISYQADNEELTYYWNDARPKRSTMAKLYKLLEKGYSND